MDKSYKLDRRRSIYEYLSTVRLTIVLCIVLAATSIIGTLIPQNQPYEYYLNRYGIRVAPALKKIGFFDLYHSAFFVGLLCLLGLNLVFCTLRRFPNVWRSLRRQPRAPSLEGIEKWRHTAKFPLHADATIAEKALKDALGKVIGKPTRSTIDGAVFYGAQRGRYSRLGPYITHASVLLILIGAVVGSLFGFRGFVTIPEGGQVDAVHLTPSGPTRPLGFTIQCLRFTITHYPNGTPKEYRSEIAIKDLQGRVVLEGPVRVNHPLTYNGITLYQSTYGSTPEVTLSVRDRTTGTVTTVKTGLNRSFEISSSRDTVKAMLLNFEPNFQMPPEMARLLQSPQRSLGPAAQIVLLKDQGPQDVFWIFKEFPHFNQERQGEYVFEIGDYTMHTYTGLQVVKDPATWVIWTGCVLMVIGFVLSFFFEHHLVWVTFRPERDGTGGEVLLAGRGLRHPASYKERFDKVAKLFEKELSQCVPRYTTRPIQEKSELEHSRDPS